MASQARSPREGMTGLYLLPPYDAEAERLALWLRVESEIPCKLTLAENPMLSFTYLERPAAYKRFLALYEEALQRIDRGKGAQA